MGAGQSILRSAAADTQGHENRFGSRDALFFRASRRRQRLIGGRLSDVVVVRDSPKADESRLPGIEDLPIFGAGPADFMEHRRGDKKTGGEKISPGTGGSIGVH